MILFIAVALLAAGPPPETSCAIDRRAALKLSEAAFDQGGEGWRGLARPGCFAAAADLIREYRGRHRGSGRMLWWHEGQMRAAAGQTRAAIPLFRAARSAPNEWRVDSGWNDYVAASIAFLTRDRAALLRSRATLAALPPPAEQPQVAVAARSQPRPEDWPPNLAVVDGLIRCFDRPYAEAVNPNCRP